MLGRGFRVTFTKRCYCLCGDKVLRSQNGGNYLGEFRVPWGLDTNWFPAHRASPDCQTSLQHGNTGAYKGLYCSDDSEDLESSVMAAKISVKARRWWRVMFGCCYRGF